MTKLLGLSWLPEHFWVLRLASGTPVPDLPVDGFSCMVRTSEATTLILPASGRPASAPPDTASGPWRCFRVDGPIDHGVVGVLASLSAALAGAKIPVFAISEFDTDYVLVPAERAPEASAALQAAGHPIRNQP